MKYSKKNKFIKEWWGGGGIPLLNFEGDPGPQVPGSRGPGPTFKPCQ